MNILFLHRLWPSFGGGETVTKCLASELIKRGHSVYVLYFKEKRNMSDSVNVDDKVIQNLIPGVSFDENSSEFFVNQKEAKYVSQFLVNYVKAKNIDIIINQWWPVEYHKDIQIKTNVKIIKCLHMDPDTRKVLTNIKGIKGSLIRALEPLYRIVERKKHLYSCDKYVTNVDKLVFLAPSYQDFYVSHTKVKDVKYRTSFVYNPVVYSFKASKEDLINKKKEIIVVGRLLEKHKQVSRILTAWNSIDDVRRNDWKLRIVGDGPDRLFYENIVSSQNIKDVSFEGFQNPLPFYKNASILLMSSAYEGWPMSIIEAMQNGVAVVAMNTFKSASDIIKNGENGILTSSDIHEFSKAIQKLMINTELRRKLALNGMYSCSQYSVEKVVDRWINLFESLYGNEK